jgi:hypothetical protein
LMHAADLAAAVCRFIQELSQIPSQYERAEAEVPRR